MWSSEQAFGSGTGFLAPSGTTSNFLDTAGRIPALARPSGATDRSALPIAGNDTQTKTETAAYGRIYFADPSAPDAQLANMGPEPTPASDVKAALDTAVRVNVDEPRF